MLMRGDELLALRNNADMTQFEVATTMGISLRTYQRFEKLGAKMVPTYIALAMERFLMQVAVAQKNPMVAPEQVRADALDLTALIRG